MTPPSDPDRWLAALLDSLRIGHGPVTPAEINQANNLMLDMMLLAAEAEDAKTPRPIRETPTD